MKRIKFFLAFVLVSGAIVASLGAADSRMMHYPDINGNLVVFVYAGDIWSVDAEGGNARRLTSHEGMELFPKISPDGQWIAFSGEYGGNRQVFIMPSEGGVPQQLTWYNSVGAMPPRGGFDNVVLDWTPDSRKVLFRSNRTEFGERNGKYFLVRIDGGPAENLPIVNGGIATFSPDAGKLCFTPVDREFRTWKRYKGGRATDLWIYDLNENASEQITDFTGSDQWPVWEGNNIFFVSDRDLKLNIYRFNTQTREITQMTHFTEMDVLWPSGQHGHMVFENDGFLYKMNLETGATEKIIVNIHFDNPNLVSYFKNVKDNIHSASISPTGKRVLLDARGDIFSVPAEQGSVVNLTKTQGIREIFPVWSPDGKNIVYYSDASGEYEIYLLENKKGAEPEQLTSGSSAWKNNSVWSPDSRYLVYSDRTLNLKLLDMKTKKEHVIDRAADSEISDYSFSPDSKWIAYSKESPNGQPAVWVYQINEETTYQLTDHTFSDYSPVFSEDGNYIFFFSNRHFNISFSSFEFDYLYNNAVGIYAMILKADGPKLIKDKNDVEPVQKEEDAEAEKEKGKDEKEEEKTVEVQIDREGINNRIEALPLSSGGYRNLMPVKGGLLYLNQGKLEMYDLEEEKSKGIMDGISGVQVSADKNMMLYRFNNAYGVLPVKPDSKPDAGKLKLDNLEMKIDPAKEWVQIFNDGWRIFRDYFYVDNLHGVDWQAVKERYGQWVPYLGSRAGLDFILGEMVSESNVGHAYVNRGDSKEVERIDGGLLGARLEPESHAGRFRIAGIYDSENWNSRRRSPLRAPGVDVTEGDYLLAVNGQNITTKENPYRYLENLAGKRTEITVSDNADGSNPRTSVIEPVPSEGELMYLTWVNQRRKMVDDLSGGRIGYIHVPNTSQEGNRELFRGMYAYHDKEALIIDDRYNGGGFIPDVMTDLLDRKTLSYWQRNGLNPMRTPDIAHDGPKAMLINGYSSSGGDAFPFYFKKKELGVLIGTRTWGGLVGISGNASLVDGGSISVPQFGVYDENGEWIIEGIGIYPDIEVTDRPEQLAKGEDPSIEKAVEVLLKQLEEKPAKKVKTPEPPDRSEWIEKKIE
jgi:tricorn protease